MHGHGHVDGRKLRNDGRESGSCCSLARGAIVASLVVDGAPVGVRGAAKVGIDVCVGFSTVEVEGDCDGATSLVSCCDGCIVGSSVGIFVGLAVGFVVGLLDGTVVGMFVSCRVGLGVGGRVANGAAEGATVGQNCE